MLQVLKPSNPLRRVFGHGWVVATAYPGRARLRLTGCREPSPGQERAESWPFGLPSSRLRPCRAARSACIAPGRAVPGICNVRYRRIAVGPGPPGRCNSRDQDLCPAQEITLQLPTARARSRPARGQLHRSLWPLLGLARWAILRALAVASECLRRPRGCPPWIRRLKGAGFAREIGVGTIEKTE